MGSHFHTSKSLCAPTPTHTHTHHFFAMTTSTTSMGNKLMTEMVASPMPEVCKQWIPSAPALDKALNCCDKCCLQMMNNVLTWVSDDAADYDGLAKSVGKLHRQRQERVVVSDEKCKIVDNEFCVPTGLPSLEATPSHVSKLARALHHKQIKSEVQDLVRDSAVTGIDQKCRKAAKAAFLPWGKIGKAKRKFNTVRRRGAKGVTRRAKASKATAVEMSC